MNLSAARGMAGSKPGWRAGDVRRLSDLGRCIVRPRCPADEDLRAHKERSDASSRRLSITYARQISTSSIQRQSRPTPASIVHVEPRPDASAISGQGFNAAENGSRRRNVPWTDREQAHLQALLDSSASRDEIQTTFPKKPWHSILAQIKSFSGKELVHNTNAKAQSSTQVPTQASERMSPLPPKSRYTVWSERDSALLQSLITSGASPDVIRDRLPEKTRTSISSKIRRLELKGLADSGRPAESVKTRKRMPFSPEEIRKLMELEMSGSSLRDIQKQFPNRTPTSLRSRVNKARIEGSYDRDRVDNTVSRVLRHWTAQEVARLIQLREVEKMPFPAIAKALSRPYESTKIKYRSIRQFENPSVARPRYTAEEDAIILRMRNAVPRRTKLDVAELQLSLPHRSRSSISARARLICHQWSSRSTYRSPPGPRRLAAIAAQQQTQNQTDSDQQLSDMMSPLASSAHPSSIESPAMSTRSRHQRLRELRKTSAPITARGRATAPTTTTTTTTVSRTKQSPTKHAMSSRTSVSTPSATKPSRGLQGFLSHKYKRSPRQR